MCLCHNFLKKNPPGFHLDVVHHLQIKVVFGALQNQSAAHVGGRVVEVKDDIIGLWASFRSKYPVDLLGSLDLIGQVISSWGTAGHTHTHTYQTAIRCRHIQILSDNPAKGTMMKLVNDLQQGVYLPYESCRTFTEPLTMGGKSSVTNNLQVNT